MRSNLGHDQPLLWTLPQEDRRIVLPGALSEYPDFMGTLPPGVARHLANRPFQLPTIAEILHRMSRARSAKIVVGAPTGAGKGTILAYLCHLLLRNKRVPRILVVTPRVVISDQLRRDLNRIQVGSAGTVDSPVPIHVCTVHTVLARAKAGKLPDYDILMLDEVHHFVGNDWATIIDLFPHAPAIGFTATTERADGRALGEVFDTLIEAINYEQLLEQGFIVPCDVYCPDYPLGGNLARSPLDAYRDFAPDRGPTLVFERSIDTAKSTLAAFREAGIGAEVITQKTPAKRRNEILDDFKAGRTPVLINIVVLTEGVNVPAASVAIVANTCNETRWRQVTGRVLRAAEGKRRALVIDLIGNACLLGNPTLNYLYSLDRTAEVKGWSEASLNGAREMRDDRVPEILNCALYDQASLASAKPVVIKPATSQYALSVDQEKYFLELKQAVRDGKLSPQIARQHYERRHGKTRGDIDFR